MRDSDPQLIRLSDYKPHNFSIDHIDLSFNLSPTQTLVTTKMRVSQAINTSESLVLNGEKLILKSIKINNVLLKETDFLVSLDTLTIHHNIIPAETFELEIQTEINPQGNTELEGLYLSNGMYCTQCEAEGFRKITYYIDRPDNMAEFFVTIIGESHQTTPVLLSNGNLIQEGMTDDNRPFSRWHDPFKKPCYLFALVAGNLGVTHDQFITKSGRNVSLRIYVEHDNVKNTSYAMDALKRSMKWDEDVYGLEYDLDLFMIVGVSDFNFGAMENKGLNIFNSKYILADPETTTDSDYEAIEGIVAHEYFHNWTGNRVTCRDWFQLCLKEGLTVFRDQSFSADMHCSVTKRIDDVITLRTSQFSEDSGPLAHCVRPETYMEINNFYTATVYEKGAELCRMLHLKLGKKAFHKGIDLYFKRFDGMAVTVEDFIQAMADATETDLSQFLLWYKQPGTPVITARGQYQSNTKQYQLSLEQNNRDTHSQPRSYIMDIPVLIAFISQSGTALTSTYQGQTHHEHLIKFDTQTQEFLFENIHEDCIPSLFRKFSAPIILADNFYSDQEKFLLMKHDTDLFNRYDTAQTLAQNIIFDDYHNRPSNDRADQFINSLANTLGDTKINHSFLAYILTLPSITQLIQNTEHANPAKILIARKNLQYKLADHLYENLDRLFNNIKLDPSYVPSAEQSAARHLRNMCLGYLVKNPKFNLSKLEEMYDVSHNMTDRIGVLSALSDIQNDLYKKLMKNFYNHFQKNPIVIDKWFALQARASHENTLQAVKDLLKHPEFSYKNPNRARSLIGVLLHGNPAQFHTDDGYAFAKEQILILDKINPKTASRMATAFESVLKLSPELQKTAQTELHDILSVKDTLSKDLLEIVSKIYASIQI